MLTSLLTGMLVGGLSYRHLSEGHHRQFEHTAHNNLYLLRHSIEQAPPAGAVRSLGLTNRRAVDALRDAPTPSPQTIASLTHSLTVLRDVLGADLAYIMNTNGTVIACSPYGNNETLTGNNYAFRPYFQDALAGHPNVYLALGVTTDRRGLYYAAPVLEHDESGESLGVAVIKAPMHMADERLAGMHTIALLIAPDNTVFAANLPDLILKPFDAEHIGVLTDYKGVRYARFEASIPFTGGPVGWRVLFMDPISGWVPPLVPASAGFGAATIVAILLFALLRWQLGWKEREATLTHAHRQLHHEVEESREQVSRLAAAVNQVAESILITGTDGTIIYANPYLLNHTGFSHDEVIGAHVRVFKSGRQDADFYRQLWTTLSAGRVWRGRFINCKKDGSTFEEEAVISPIRLNSDGPVTGYVAVKRDITETQMLEHQVRESQKMAAIGQLAHKVAHDFTNMLVVIMGHAELVRKDAQTPDLKVHAKAILEAVKRITPLTSELMVFAQPADITPHQMDLARAIAGMTPMLRDLAPATITVTMKTPDGCGKVCIDSTVLERALGHLAVNAFEAMPEGGQLTVATKPLTGGERAALITISDTGHGIPAKHIDRVFEPFFTTKPDKRNAGLGLSTVYRIVTRHDGRITVESRPGHGTTFRITLPLA